MDRLRTYRHSVPRSSALNQVAPPLRTRLQKERPLIRSVLIVTLIALALPSCASRWRYLPGYEEAQAACRRETHNGTGEALALAVSPLLLPIGVAADAQAMTTCMTGKGWPPGAVVRERIQ